MNDPPGEASALGVATSLSQSERFLLLEMETTIARTLRPRTRPLEARLISPRS